MASCAIFSKRVQKGRQRCSSRSRSHSSSSLLQHKVFKIFIPRDSIFAKASQVHEDLIPRFRAILLMFQSQLSESVQQAVWGSLDQVCMKESAFAVSSAVACDSGRHAHHARVVLALRRADYLGASSTSDRRSFSHEKCVVIGNSSPTSKAFCLSRSEF